MADTKISAMTDLTTLASGDEVPVADASDLTVAKSFTLATLTTFIGDLIFARINGSSGAAGAYKTLQKLSANSADQTSTTPAAVMTTTDVGAGTWYFKYYGLYQTAATTTGIKLVVNHTGTTGQFASIMYFPDNAATAASGVGLGIAGAAIGRVFSAYAEAVKDTSSFASVGVITANADIPVIVEGFVVVTVTGSLELKMGTEVAASAVRLMADSLLELTKVG